jgi:phosphoglycolate phosphatase-like HAD superfamily hydrolase
MGLLTGNFKENAYLKLSTFKLEKFFPFGAFGSDNEDRNKLPEIAINRANDYMRVINHNYTRYDEINVFNTNNTIIIGDSPGDIECAKSNGIFSLAVSTGTFCYKELKKCNPDFIIENFSNYTFVVSYIVKRFINYIKIL